MKKLASALGLPLAIVLLAWTELGQAAPPTEVVVVNPASAPVRARDVDNPARQPFQARIRIDVLDGFEGENVFLDVPAGKRLVIEYASAQGFAPTGQVMFYEVGTLIGAQLSFDQNHAVPVIQQITGSGVGIFIAGQQVRIYADSGPAKVMLRAARNGSAGPAHAFFSISGYFVNVPN